MDGSQKLPQRAVDPYLELQKRNLSSQMLPVLIAGWMHYILSLASDGKSIVDPLEAMFKEIAAASSDKHEKAQAFLAIEKIFGCYGIENQQLKTQVLQAFESIENNGIGQVIRSLVSNQE